MDIIYPSHVCVGEEFEVKLRGCAEDAIAIWTPTAGSVTIANADTKGATLTVNAAGPYSVSVECCELIAAAN